MGLQANAQMTFMDYEVTDEGINMHFVCYYPGPGQNNDYYVLLTDADLSGVNTPAQFQTLVITKLQRKFRAQGIASKLDTYIGQSVTI